MDHVAIMNNQKKLISKILLGEKTIETRWYIHKVAPWNSIKAGDNIYFKESGKLVTAQATVSNVLQFELENLSKNELLRLVKKYSKDICFTNSDTEIVEWIQQKNKKYAMLVFLKNPQPIVKPFAITKKGYGSAAAWMCVGDIKKVKN